MRYGQEGLFLDLFYNDSKLGRVILSKNYEKIYNFLGLSYDKYLEGFDELEDIFEYISESKFFNHKMFQLDQLNKINRDRNVKRKSYMSFLDWISKKAFDENQEKNIDLTKYDFKYIDQFFPEAKLTLEIRRLEYEHYKKKYINSKFNGGDVMRRYGIQGKELGDAMTGFKNIIGSLFPNETYEDYIINNTVEHIYSDFDIYMTPTNLIQI
jgi:hypothetical protein